MHEHIFRVIIIINLNIFFIYCYLGGGGAKQALTIVSWIRYADDWLAN